MPLQSAAPVTTVSQTAPAVVPATTMPAVVNPVYQVWQGLQGAVLCDADRVCGPNRYYARSPVAATVSPTVAPVTPVTVSGTGPVSTSLPAPPWMQSIGSQGIVQQPVPVVASTGTPVMQTSSGVFVPSPSAATPVVSSQMPTSGVFVPSPANASVQFTQSMGRGNVVPATGSPVQSMPGPAPVSISGTAAAIPVPPANPVAAVSSVPAGAEPPFAATKSAKPEGKTGAKSQKRSKKAKCCGCF